MTEKKQGAPVREPMPAGEPAKAAGNKADNNKIWHYNGKFPVVVDYLVFFGIFLGGWILALAEIAKVFPVFIRRLKLTQGMSLVIISIAVGKSLGSLLYYAQGWM